jgi:hypothetical protein
MVPPWINKAALKTIVAIDAIIGAFARQSNNGDNDGG